VHQRDGALEVSIPSAAPDAPRDDHDGGADLLWRVRILAVSDTEITVEQPSAAGRWVSLAEGVRLIAVMAIGQNRWMFHTRIISVLGGQQRIMHLQMPTTVERCIRRNFYRISTAELSLPRVECWPLLDPTSVTAAEVANRDQIQSLSQGPGTPRLSAAPSSEEPLLLPEVGPRFSAQLVNLGGGGVGLLVDPREASATERARLLWLRIDLTPQIPAPIAMTARPVHTHLDSAQNLYMGLAFEWAFNPAHREFIVEQIGRYADMLQKSQRRSAA
jgi:hypothetical protein